MAYDPNAQTSQHDVTQLLKAWSAGDKAVQDQLIELTIDELRRRAQGYLRRERQGHTLQPTALVNEVYLRLVDQSAANFNDRTHFFAVAAQLMRRILVDHARTHRAEKRGGQVQRVELDEARDHGDERGIDLIALDDALHDLAKLDARQSRIVELRYFAGLTVDECAEVLNVGHATVSRDWRNARAYLQKVLELG